MAEYTKEQVITAFRTKNPSYSFLDNEDTYKLAIKNNPKIQISKPIEPPPVPSEQLKKREENPTENSILDSNPVLNTIKDGYNRSLTGMTHAMSTNKQQVYDLKDYNPNLVQDLGAGLMSFFMPLDLGTTIGGGGFAGQAAKIAAKKTISKYIATKLLKNGASIGVAKTAAKKAIARAGAVSAGSGALGTYQGANDALAQQIQTGEINFGKVARSSGKGALLGLATSGTNVLLTEKGIGSLTRVAAEIGVFGASTPLMEENLRAPELKDFTHAAGMVLGLKTTGKIFAKGKDSLTPILKEYAEGKRNGAWKMEMFPEGTESILKQKSKDRAIKLQQKRDLKNTYYNAKGDIVKVTGRKKGKVYTSNLDGTVVKKYNEKTFKERFKSESFSKNPRTVREKNESDIRTLEKKIGIKDTQKTVNRIVSMSKKNLGIATKALKDDKLNKRKNLKLFNSESLNTYKKQLQKDFDLKTTTKNLEKNGILTKRETTSLFFDTLLPKKVSNILDPFRPTINQGSDAFARRLHSAEMHRHKLLDRNLRAEGLSAMKTSELIGNPNQQRKEVLAKELNLPIKEITNSNYYTYLSDAINKGSNIEHAVAARRILKRQFNRAKEAGVDVSGFIPNYLPNIAKDGVSEIIVQDFYNIAKKAYSGASQKQKDKAKASNVTELFDIMVSSMINPVKFAEKNKGLTSLIEKLIKNGQSGMNPQTRKAFKHVLKNSKSGVQSANSYFKALAEIGNEVYRVKHGRSGHLENKRRRDNILPPDYYERDASKLIARYIQDSSRRTSEVSIFGRQNKYVNKILKNKDISLIDKNIIQELQAHVSGSINYQDKYAMGSGIISKDLTEKILFWNTATKIGLGTATALNTTQLFLSSGFEAGYGRMFRGGFKYVTDKNFKKLVDSSPADLNHIVNELMGFSKSKGRLKTFAELTTKWSGFNKINSINNIISAATASVFTDDLIKIVQKNGTLKFTGNESRRKQVAWAKSKLEQLGVDLNQVKKDGIITRNKRLEIMGSFAAKTQLHKDLLNDPIFMNRPSLRLYTQFKTFGVRNANYMTKTIENDLLHYNVMPVLRLAATGIAGTGIALQSKDFMKYLFSGEKSFEPEEFIKTDGKEIIEAIGAIGAFGSYGSIMNSIFEEGGSFNNSGFLRTSEFLLAPAFWSDLKNAEKVLSSMGSDASNFGGNMIYRFTNKLLKLTNSPLLKQLSKRFETKGLKINRIKYTRGRRIASLRDSIINNNSSEEIIKAKKDARDWNIFIQSLPVYLRKYKINNEDFDKDEINKAIIRKHKKIL